MPFHRIPRRDAETMVPQIEATGERVAFVFAYGDQFDIFTEEIGAVVDGPNGVEFRKVDRITTKSEAVAVDLAPITVRPL
jgi:hypothetical protein